MTWAAVIVAGGALVSGAMGSKASKDAAKKASGSAQQGLDFTKSVYADSQGNFQPYMEAGQNALGGLTALNNGDYSGFQNSPDYLWAQAQGINTLDHSAASGGRLDSGGYQKDLLNYSQGLASQQLNNYRNSLQYLTTAGQNAAGTLGGIGTGTSQMVNGQYNTMGQAGAANAINQGNIAAGTVGAIGNAFGQYYNSRPATTSSYTTPASGGWNQYGGPPA